MTLWDSKYHSCSDRGKCPTQLGILAGDRQQSEWGYNIPFDRKHVMRWFKLMLLNPEDLPRDAAESKYMKEAASCLEKRGKSAEDAVADFLRLLWQHCLNAMYRDRGREEIDQYKTTIVITVPAIWPNYAQAKMTRAAERAGMLSERGRGMARGKPDLRFVSEPEAAALAVLADFHPKPNIKDDTIVVCDAGGGTTDLISYQVSKPIKFELRETVSGEGELVSGVMVDDEFEEFISSTIGHTAWNKLDVGDIAKFMKEDWELCVKEQFTGAESKFWIEVPDGYLVSSTNKKRKRTTTTVPITRKDLLPVFDGVVDKICALVQRQVDGIKKKDLPDPKFIILVGGFGCCRYLFNRLDAAHPDCTVLNPPVRDSWTAVCRGAVRCGLNRLGTKRSHEVTVEERISRVGYGFHFRIPFNEKYHDPRDKIYEEFEEQYMADSQMDWFLKPGQVLPSKSASNHRYYELLSADNPASLEEDLFYCCSDELPMRRTDDVKQLCTIKWENSVDLRGLEKLHNSKGETFYKVHYTIRVTIEGPNLHIDVLRGSQKMAERNVFIDYK
ncbi:Heat shock protein Hsp70 [Cordyceps fumosorosea ARSEF 2679]|uniref:Heat shock protein Hsp70 n=1 Tax=Cordyceps fumosorosea (strain ARSEF 2679) TaxID=1081104 RepID=A0A167ZI45_CORFA|nr:Heat shock protein Hsp70 [Cordyceps fumosorosea ARSEF 2679]OAA67546.1 Heat shock protein Hsp70 [Cordyceps fumosorosea ARSEF 2679]